MAVAIAKTVESPCRTCENVHLNKDECSRDCVRLHAFQDAILQYDERNIREFRAKVSVVKH